jgi:cytochrome d ubiquinol oxidase subunit I
VIRKNANGVEYAAVTDWWQMAFNPSALSHLSHVFLGCWMAGSFLIISVASYYLLKKRYIEFALRSMKIGMIIAIASVTLQLVSADHLSKLISKYNPVKFAAFEGVFKTEEYTPIYAFGYVDTQNQKVYGPSVPGVLSFLVHGDIKTPVAGLDQAPKENWPWVQAVFQVYHLMVTTWGLMFIGVLMGIWMWRKNSWQKHPWMLKYLVVAVTFPQIGNMAGWYSTCLGRQPWSVYKLLKTKDAYSPSVSAGEALFTLCLFMFVYISLFVLFCFLLDHKIKHGPTDLPEESPYRDPFKKE